MKKKIKFIGDASIYTTNSLSASWRANYHKEDGREEDSGGFTLATFAPEKYVIRDIWL